MSNSDGDYRIRNVATFMYTIGTCLCFVIGLTELFAFSHLWGIALVVVPTVVALAAKAIAEGSEQ